MRRRLFKIFNRDHDYTIDIMYAEPATYSSVSPGVYI